MKFLTVCEGGAVRSVALASLLRWEFGHDAVPLSGKRNSDEVIMLLSDWADHIVVLVPEFAKRIPKRYMHKVRVVDIGPDIWFNSLHKDLLRKLGDLIHSWDL